MSITSAIVLFAVLWFLVLFCYLPFVSHTQQQEGKVEPGTHASAPSDFKPGRVARRVSLITVVLWVLLSAVILSGAITVRDFDVMNRLGSSTVSGTNE
jgi:predicted secreted protein